MTIHTSWQVDENRRLAKEQPERFKLALTTYVDCAHDGCEHRCEEIQKDAPYVTWYCPEHYCEAPWEKYWQDKFEDLTAALKAMQEVRLIHKPVYFEDEVDCTVCHSLYPCPTIEALGGEANHHG